MKEVRLAIVLAPAGATGVELRQQALVWYNSGIIDDCIWVTNEQLRNANFVSRELEGEFISSEVGTDYFDVYQYLGSSLPVGRLDLIVPWILADDAPDVKLAELGLKVSRNLKEVMPVPSSNGKSRGKRLYTTLLSIPSSDLTRSDLGQTHIPYEMFDVNVYVSPESRSNPWSASAPLKVGANFELFALGQLASVAGLWSGSSESISSLLSSQAFKFGLGNVLLLRSMASLVVAQGIASRMVDEALSDLTNPEFDPYQISDPSDTSRPASIEPNAALIEQELMARVNSIIDESDGVFSYEGMRRPDALDFTRSGKEALKFFWRFTGDVVKAMPRYTMRWFKNAWTSFLNKTLKQVKPAHPEIYLGLDQELKARLEEAEQFRSNTKRQDALAISATAYQQNPLVWQRLRESVFGALDGSDALAGIKPRVLPNVRYVAPDPQAKFDISDAMREQLDLTDTKLSLPQVLELSIQIGDKITEGNQALDQIRSKIQDLRTRKYVEEQYSGLISLDDREVSSLENSEMDDSSLGSEMRDDQGAEVDPNAADTAHFDGATAIEEHEPPAKEKPAKRVRKNSKVAIVEPENKENLQGQPDTPEAVVASLKSDGDESKSEGTELKFDVNVANDLVQDLKRKKRRLPTSETEGGDVDV